MDEHTLTPLRHLLHTQPVAALATLHRGEPAVSMVPWAPTAEGTALLIHVSDLATHTQDMRVHPKVALLVHGSGPASADHEPGTALARPRVSIKAHAACVPRDHAAHAACRAAYLARFPEAQDLFDFADFSLWQIEPTEMRFVAGFGRAYAVPAAHWCAVLRPGASSSGGG